MRQKKTLDGGPNMYYAKIYLRIKTKSNWDPVATRTISEAHDNK